MYKRLFAAGAAGGFALSLLLGVSAGSVLLLPARLPFSSRTPIAATTQTAPGPTAERESVTVASAPAAAVVEKETVPAPTAVVTANAPVIESAPVAVPVSPAAAAAALPGAQSLLDLLGELTGDHSNGKGQDNDLLSWLTGGSKTPGVQTGAGGRRR